MTHATDDLIERLEGAASKARIMDVFARDANGNPMKDHGTSWPIVIVGKDLILESAAEIEQLRGERDVQSRAADMIAEERDALRADIERYVERDTERVREMEGMRDLLRRLRQWDMLSEGNTPRLADRDYWCEQIDAAIDAAREKP